MVITRRRARSFVREQRGAVLVEFALVLVLLLVLVFGIIDFGRALYTANSLNTAAREGARYAAVLEDPAAMAAAIQDTVMHHMSPLGGAPLARDDVTVTFNYATSGPGVQSTTVLVRYAFRPLTPIASLVGLGRLTLSASAQFRAEFGS